MEKQLKTFISEVFEENNIDFSVNKFFRLLKKKEKAFRTLKKKRDLQKSKVKEVLCTIEKFDDDDYAEGWTLLEMLSEEIDCYINCKHSVYDLFAQENYPDEGVTNIFYVKYENDFYEAEVHCSAQWVGDWSVRANTPDSTSVKYVKKVKCDVINEHEIKLR